MPVSTTSKLIHIHIPKTAGTFIEKSLRKNDNKEPEFSSLIKSDYRNNRWYEFQHLTFAELITMTGDKFTDYRSFAIVRNPYERLVSEYKWRWSLFEGGFDVDGIFFKSFEDLIDAIPLDIASNWDNHIMHANRHFANFLIHIRPQYHYICAPNGASGVEKIIHFETIYPDLNHYLSTFTNEISGIRAFQNEPIPICFHRRIVNLVNKIYKEDFIMGGYEML